MPQEQMPDFGFDPPIRTRAKCTHPEFADPNYHRVKLVTKPMDTQGLAGWSVERRCVGCGRVFSPGKFFVAPSRISSFLHDGTKGKP